MANRAAVEFENRLNEALPEGSTKIRGRIASVRGSVITENLWFSTRQGDLQVVVGANDLPVLLNDDGSRVSYDPTESTMSQRTREIINGRNLISRIGMLWLGFRSSFSLRELAGELVDEVLDEPLALIGFPIVIAIILGVVGFGVPLICVLLAIVALEGIEGVGRLVGLSDGHDATWGERWHQLGTMDLIGFWTVVGSVLLLLLTTLITCGKITNKNLLRSITLDQKVLNNFVLSKLNYSAWGNYRKIRFQVSPGGKGQTLASATRSGYELP